MTQRLRGSTAATAAGALAVAVVLAFVLAGHRADFAQALRQAPVWVLLVVTAHNVWVLAEETKGRSLEEISGAVAA